MRNPPGFLDEIDPVAGNDDISAIRRLAQDRPIVGGDREDIAEHNDPVPQRAQRVSQIMRSVMIEKKGHLSSSGAICRATRTSISPL